MKSRPIPLKWSHRTVLSRYIAIFLGSFVIPLLDLCSSSRATAYLRHTSSFILVASGNKFLESGTSLWRFPEKDEPFTQSKKHLFPSAEGRFFLPNIRLISSGVPLERKSLYILRLTAFSSENRFTPSFPVHYVVPCIPILYSQWPADNSELTYSGLTVNRRLDPLTTYLIILI